MQNVAMNNLQLGQGNERFNNQAVTYLVFISESSIVENLIVNISSLLDTLE